MSYTDKVKANLLIEIKNYFSIFFIGFKIKNIIKN